MKFLNTLFCCLLLSISVFGQTEKQKPNYAEIEKNIKDKKSGLHYEKLFEKFLTGDTSFTITEKQHLYYGYQFQKNYSPYGSSDFSDSLKKVLNKEELDSNDVILGIKYGNNILEKFPFDLRTLNILSRLYSKNGDEQNSAKLKNRRENIIAAILSSGDGLTDTTALYILSISDEYDMLRILGLKFGGSQSLRGGNDYLKVTKNEYGIEGMYFDVSAPFGSMSRMFKK